MRKLSYVAVFFAVLVCVSACAIQTNVSTASIAAAEVVTGKSVSSPVEIQYAVPDPDLNVDVHTTGFRGSACHFPLNLADAFRGTFDAVNEQAFRNLVPPGASPAYRVRFNLNSFDHDVSFASGFPASLATAHVELSVRVTVTDPQQREIARQIIRGAGEAEAQGACDAGSPALSAAAGKSLRALGEEYADRVVNGLAIK